MSSRYPDLYFSDRAAPHPLSKVGLHQRSGPMSSTKNWLRYFAQPFTNLIGECEIWHCYQTIDAFILFIHYNQFIYYHVQRLGLHCV